MPTYLLGTKCIADIASNNNNPAYQWFYAAKTHPSVFRRDVVISAFSILKLRDSFNSLPNTIAANAFIRNVDQFIGHFEYVHNVEGADAGVVAEWALHRKTPILYQSNGNLQPIGIEEQLVLATALRGNYGRGFTLVDPFQQDHKGLKIKVHDPYRGVLMVP